jgi:hypothetical protein
MALRLNLYHEIEQQKAIKRRDPLKLSMIGLGLIAFGFAAYYLFEFGVEHSLTSEAAQIQGEADRLKPKFEAAKKREDELSLSVKLSDAMIRRIEGRFYWAPLLDTIAQIVPREAQVTTLVGDVSNDKYKRANITLSGVCAGEEPRKVAEDLRRALNDKLAAKYKHVSAIFRVLDDGKELATLDGKQYPTASFDINLLLQAGDDDPATPPPKKKR